MLHGGARGQNGGHLFFFLLLFYLNGIIQFKQKVLFRIDFLSVTSHCKVQCPRMGLEVKIWDTLAGVYVPLGELFLVSWQSRAICRY